MNKPRYRVMALLIAACSVVLVATAVFSGVVSAPNVSAEPTMAEAVAASVNQPLASRTPPAGQAVSYYPCPRCRTNVSWGTAVCARCGWCMSSSLKQMACPVPKDGPLGLGAPDINVGRIDQAIDMIPAAGGAGTGRAARPPWTGAAAVANTDGMSALPDPATSQLLSPRDQNAAGKEMIEGHWLGLEVIPLIPELAKEFRIPYGETGILVDEITLEAAESGVLAGDMIQSIDGHPTSDLRAFFVATQKVQEKERATIGVSRRGEKRSFEIQARNSTILGFAQMEAAQPIRPGALSPHRLRGRACTDCHLIMVTGGQLPTDAGDVLPTPPVITKNATPPHGDRGRCAACHVVR